MDSSSYSPKMQKNTFEKKLDRKSWQTINHFIRRKHLIHFSNLRMSDTWRNGVTNVYARLLMLMVRCMGWPSTTIFSGQLHSQRQRPHIRVVRIVLAWRSLVTTFIEAKHLMRNVATWLQTVQTSRVRTRLKYVVMYAQTRRWPAYSSHNKYTIYPLKENAWIVNLCRHCGHIMLCVVCVWLIIN